MELLAMHCSLLGRLLEQATLKIHGGINLNPKSTDLEVKHVVWAINHKDQSIGLVCASVEEIIVKRKQEKTAFT
jgi:hypothetical protein